jgi:hypothetical protein
VIAERFANGRLSLGWLATGQARAIRHGIVLTGILFNLAIFIVGAPIRRTVGADAYAYWALDIDHPYTRAVGSLAAFVYTPVAARAFAPAALLSWPAFWWLWVAVLAATIVWLGWSKVLWLLAFPPVALELYYGNVNLLIAAAIVLGFRYPATWAFILLTKVTPGIGLIWFAVRREWRSLAIAVGATASLVAISIMVDAGLWREWVATVIGASQPTDNAIEIPLLLRLPAAAAIVAWGARTNRRWTVLVGAMLALPVLWLASFSVLAGVLAVDRLSPRGATP